MIQEKSRVGAKRGQHPLFPPFFPPRHHFSRVKREQIRKRREKKNKARPMFPVMPPVTSGSVSRYKLAFYAIMFNNGGEEEGKKKKKRNGLALRLHFSRDKTVLPPFRRGKLVFANEKGRARKNCCRAPTKGQRERGGGGGWKQRFAETAANNYARNALIFAQLRKPITLSDATNFIPFSLSSSFSDISGRDELPARASKTGFYLSRRFIVYVRLTRLSTPVDLFLRD